MKSKEEIKEQQKLLNECARAYTKIDKQVIEIKMLKNEIKRLKKALSR